jgi:uncharacterized Rossmann fold enzyme
MGGFDFGGHSTSEKSKNWKDVEKDEKIKRRRAEQGKLIKYILAHWETSLCGV